jgi:NRPS condensation-like uncharacterized protein|tara:strand:+ start:435 stop:725 length:291 start_codon:yes stop_codon:yes gene_type:complete
MSKDLKELSKITTRYSKLNEWNDNSFSKLSKRWSKNVNDTRDGLTELERKEGIAHPTNQKYDFKKPTVVSMDRSKIETLIKTGRLETDGLTIIYED